MLVIKRRMNMCAAKEAGTDSSQIASTEVGNFIEVE
jgi:hypothetical protein